MITLVGDIHVKKSNLEKQAELFKLIEEIPNDYVILTGDLLDNKSIVRSECLNFLYQTLGDIKKIFYIIVGNHDQHNLNTMEHSLETLKGLPNVMIVDKTTEFEIEGLNFVGIPYIHEAEKFNEEVKKIKDKKNKILVCHQGFTGFDYGNGYIAKDESDSNSVKDFKFVYVGHFHKYQDFKNGCYIGTPFSQSFGESNQIKYLGQIEKDGKLELVETDFPRHMTYEVDCDNSPEIRKYDWDDYNRIILKGSQEAINAFDVSNFKDAKILRRPTPVVEKGNVEISENLSNSKKFELWATEVGKFKPELVKLGMEVLRAASK